MTSHALLLGLSGSKVDQQIDPVRIRDGAGVPNGKLLVRFVESVHGGGDDLAKARDELADAVGADAVVDVAAVVANFYMMTRIADSTGTPLDPDNAALSVELRADLGVDDYVSKRVG